MDGGHASIGKCVFKPASSRHFSTSTKASSFGLHKTRSRAPWSLEPTTAVVTKMIDIAKKSNDTIPSFSCFRQITFLATG